MSGLSEREQRILEYMREYVAKWGYPPTVRDVAGALGIKSTSTVHKSIAALEKAGAIYSAMKPGRRSLKQRVSYGLFRRCPLLLSSLYPIYHALRTAVRRGFER